MSLVTDWKACVCRFDLFCPAWEVNWKHWFAAGSMLLLLFVSHMALQSLVSFSCSIVENSLFRFFAFSYSYWLQRVYELGDLHQACLRSSCLAVCAVPVTGVFSLTCVLAASLGAAFTRCAAFKTDLINWRVGAVQMISHQCPSRLWNC